MSMERWAAVDTYLAEHLLPRDDILESVHAANHAAGLPAIDVSPAQAKFLHLLVRMIGARAILEIGTLGGYSSICMARALPADGRLVTLEYEPRHAAVARQNLERAGVSDRVEVRVGAALDTLPGVEADGAGPFDLVFIDADKPNNPAYLEWAVRLSRPGTVIVLDNVVRAGEVAQDDSGDVNVLGAREGLAFMGRHPRLDCTALQTVGVKGYDGFAIAVVS